MTRHQTVFRPGDRFYVYTKKTNKPVEAKWLFDKAGDPVINARTGKPYIAPADYSIDKAIELGHRLHMNDIGRHETYLIFKDILGTDGVQDLQRSYNGKVSGGGKAFVEEFRDIASWHFGLISAAADVNSTIATIGGGFQNLQNYFRGGDIDTSGEFWNNPRNPPNIRAGYQFYHNDSRSGASSLPDQPSRESYNFDDYLHDDMAPNEVPSAAPRSNKPKRDLFEEFSEEFPRNDGKSSDNKTFNNLNKTHSAPLGRVQLAAPRRGAGEVSDDRLLGAPPMPQKGPERVKRDPTYNPFNRDKNGFEDLDGEVAVWKKGKAVRNRMIREAGRAAFFGLDEDAA